MHTHTEHTHTIHVHSQTDRCFAYPSKTFLMKTSLSPFVEEVGVNTEPCSFWAAEYVKGATCNS